MSQNKSSLIDIVANPGRHPATYFFLSFFVITPVLGLAINGLSTIVFELLCVYLASRFGGDKLRWQLVIIFVCILIVFFAIWLFNIPQFFKKVLSQPEPRTVKLQEQFPGLITSASKFNPNSNRPTPAEVAIRHHLKKKGSLKHCWIICTNDSIDGAKDLINKLVAENLVSQDVFHWGPDYSMDNFINYNNKLSLLVDDKYADDPNYIRELIDAIYSHAPLYYNLDESEIITDYTGATKSFTAGIILACANPKRRLQYISQFDNEIKEIKISYRLKPIQRP